MIELELSLDTEAQTITMIATVSGIDTNTKLAFKYRESLLGDWEEVGTQTITEDGEYTETLDLLEYGTYSFQVDLRQPPTGRPQVQLSSNIVVYIYEDNTVETINGYTTVGRIQNEIDASEDEAVRLIDTVTAYIDNYTRNKFIGQEGTRYYDGNSSMELTIDNFVGEPVIERGRDYYGDTLEEIEFGDYLLLPNNFEQKEIPANRIHLKGYWFREGLQNVKITATFGYSRFPSEDIIQAATRLAVLIYNKGETGRLEGVESESIGDYSVSYKDETIQAEMNDIKAILDKYKNIRI